jgi:hypothetical protein
LLAITVEPTRAANQQFFCTGNIYGETINPFEKPIDLNVTLSDENKLSINTGDAKLLAPRITSNNKIQLKFETEEFVGEYFHYTGDLFLIYPSGRLARLSCSRTHSIHRGTTEHAARNKQRSKTTNSGAAPQEA